MCVELLAGGDHLAVNGMRLTIGNLDYDGLFAGSAHNDALANLTRVALFAHISLLSFQFARAMQRAHGHASR